MEDKKSGKKVVIIVLVVLLLVLLVGLLAHCSLFIGALDVDGSYQEPEELKAPEITVGENNNWFINGIDTNISAVGEKGDQGDKGQDAEDGFYTESGTPVITVGENNHWFLNGTDTGVVAIAQKGEKGDTGEDANDGRNGDNGVDGEDGEDGDDSTSIEQKTIAKLNALLSQEGVTAKATVYERFATAGITQLTIDRFAREKHYLYDYNGNQFIVIDEAGYIAYVPQGSSYTAETEIPNDVNLWQITKDTLSDKVSNYLADGFSSTALNIKTSLDVGNNTNTATVVYDRTEATVGQNAVVRTNSFTTVLTVNAPLDTVQHYDKCGQVKIIKVAGCSYEEYGTVPYMEVSAGRVALESGANVAQLHLNNKTETVEDNVVTAKVDNTFDEIIIAKASDVSNPTYTRDSASCNEAGVESILVVQLQSNTANDETTENDYVFMSKQGILEQIIVADDADGTVNAEYVDTSDRSEDTKETAEDIANVYEARDFDGKILNTTTGSGDTKITVTFNYETRDFEVDTSKTTNTDADALETAVANVQSAVEDTTTDTEEALEATQEQGVQQYTFGETYFGGGLGTKEDPYLLCTAEHFKNIKECFPSLDSPARYFEMTCDIDLREVELNEECVSLYFCGGVEGNEYTLIAPEKMQDKYGSGSRELFVNCTGDVTIANIKYQLTGDPISIIGLSAVTGKKKQTLTYYNVDISNAPGIEWLSAGCVYFNDRIGCNTICKGEGGHRTYRGMFCMYGVHTRVVMEKCDCSVNINCSSGDAVFFCGAADTSYIYMSDCSYSGTMIANQAALFSLFTSGAITYDCGQYFITNFNMTGHLYGKATSRIIGTARQTIEAEYGSDFRLYMRDSAEDEYQDIKTTDLLLALPMSQNNTHLIGTEGMTATVTEEGNVQISNIPEGSASVELFFKGGRKKYMNSLMYGAEGNMWMNLVLDDNAFIDKSTGLTKLVTGSMVTGGITSYESNATTIKETYNEIVTVAVKNSDDTLTLYEKDGSYIYMLNIAPEYIRQTRPDENGNLVEYREEMMYRFYAPREFEGLTEVWTFDENQNIVAVCDITK